jgi:hypothetical protein
VSSERIGRVKINDLSAKRFLTMERNLPDLLATHPLPKKTLEGIIAKL